MTLCIYTFLGFSGVGALGGEGTFVSVRKFGLTTCGDGVLLGVAERLLKIIVFFHENQKMNQNNIKLQRKIMQ